MTNKQYNKFISKRANKSPWIINSLKAFLSGGTICLLGELLTRLYVNIGVDLENARLFASLTLIVISALLTGIGIFDKLAKHCGAGILVPITGFANSVTASAIEAKTEGYVMGVGAKMFNLAGPIIVYGTVASSIYGLIYYLYIL